MLTQIMGLYYGGYGGYGYGYGYLSYLVFMLPALLLGIFAQLKVKGSFNKYSKVGNSRHMSGAQMAQMVLSQHGITNVRIERVSGDLTDHYDPRTNVIRLSDPVYNSTSISALGVAAHEAGHAVQYAKGYVPIKVRSAIIPVCNFGSGVGPIMILMGCFFSGTFGYKLIMWGILLFSLIAVFQLVTLPVEFNASRRAMQVIKNSGQFSADDERGAKKVLSAAAMTYVAALITSVMQILYYVTRFTGRRSD